MSFLKKLRKPHLATFLASLILFVSCEKYEIIKQDSIITKYTAEEIFAGIFFLNNEFASEIEIISNSTLYEELNKYQNAREGIGKPERLRHFEGEVYSRRVNRKDRMVYTIYEEQKEVEISSFRGHYE